MANLSMTIGDSRQFQLTVTKSGAPVDLTSIQALSFILKTSAGNVVVTWPLGGGVVVNSPATNGIATLTVAPAMTSFATSNLSLLYNWSLIDALGNVSQALDTGTFSLTLPP